MYLRIYNVYITKFKVLYDEYSKIYLIYFVIVARNLGRTGNSAEGNILLSQLCHQIYPNVL